MNTLKRCVALLAGTLALSADARVASGQADSITRVRAWRAQHEPQILRELFDLVAIPNIAADKADIARNAQALTRMFEKAAVPARDHRHRRRAAGCRGAPRAGRAADPRLLLPL